MRGRSSSPAPPDQPPAPSLTTILAFTVGGGGLGLFAYAICTNGSWAILCLATVLVVASLGVALRWERHRDQRLS